MRIGGEAPGRRAQSRNRCQHHGLLRVTATSDRHRIPTMFCSSCSESYPEFSSHAARNTTPAGTSPMVTRRHRAMSNLRASATIIVLRFLPALSVLSDTTGPMHCLLEDQETPSQLDHPAAYSCIAPPSRALSLAVCCRSHPARR